MSSSQGLENGAEQEKDFDVLSSRSQNVAAGPWPAAALQAEYAFVLLGDFQARTRGGRWPQMEGPRQQRIVAYLLLFRDRPQQRELLAAALWPDSAPKQSRKNLRQSIWQLQRAQAEPEGSAVPLLLTQREWVRIDMSLVWTDVAVMEQVYDRVRLVKAAHLTQDEVLGIRVAVELYRGELLEGWSEPWCVRERERFRSVFLGLLEKLVDHCEASNQLADGIAFAVRLLEYDRAHEGAHQKAMRLYHRAGDRVAALRQFEKCREALHEELGVGPGHHTRALYEEIASS